jgi:hypothetical protein
MTEIGIFAAPRNEIRPRSFPSCSSLSLPNQGAGHSPTIGLRRWGKRKDHLTLANTADTPATSWGLNSTGTDRLGLMSAAIHRRERGTGAGNVVLKVDVAVEAKALVERLATHMGLSKGQATEKLLLSIPLDARGLPLWPDIDDFQDQGTLPIAKAG